MLIRRILMRLGLGCSGAALLLLALIGGPGLGRATAATITNVTAVNVTPTSFSLCWRAPVPGPAVEIFADANGITNLAGQLEVTLFPVHTGNPFLENGYFRRQSRSLLQDRIRGNGIALVQVTGCRPATTYYYRVSAVGGTGTVIYYPESGPLPSITTEAGNSFIVDDQQLILEVPGIDTSGQVVLVTHPNAAHPLASVVGDGAGTNQVIFNLNDLFEAASEGGNFAPVGAQQFDVTAMGPNYSSVSAQFTVTFGSDFKVSSGNQVSLGTEFVACTIGSTVFLAQDEGKVPVTFNSSVGIARLDLLLLIEPNRLTNFALKTFASQVDPVLSTVTPQGGSNVLLRLVAQPGQSFVGAKQLAEFSFKAVAGKDSAFVPLRLEQIQAFKDEANQVALLFGESGRAVVVATSSLLEFVKGTASKPQMLLYARTGTTCALEYSSSLAEPISWTRVNPPIAVSTVVTSVDPHLTEGITQRYYRAVEFTANPPIVQALRDPDQSRKLLIYGEPSRSYAIEYKTDLSPIAQWRSLQTNTLVNSYGYISVGQTNGMILYRLRRL